MLLNLDQTFHTIFALDRGSVCVLERSLTDMTRETTVADLASGEINYSDVVSVIEFNPIEKTSRDITEDIARDVMMVWARAGEALTDKQCDFVEMHISVQAAASFRRAA